MPTICIFSVFGLRVWSVNRSETVEIETDWSPYKRLLERHRCLDWLKPCTCKNESLYLRSQNYYFLPFLVDHLQCLLSFFSFFLSFVLSFILLLLERFLYLYSCMRSCFFPQSHAVSLWSVFKVKFIWSFDQINLTLNTLHSMLAKIQYMASPHAAWAFALLNRVG